MKCKIANIFTLFCLIISIVGISTSCSQSMFQQSKQEDTLAIETEIDVEALCQIINQNYIYINTREKYWGEACQQAKNSARTVTTAQQSLRVFENLIDQLHDPHATLGVNSDMSPRLIPSGTGIWVVERNGSFFVAGVKSGGNAAMKNIRIGDEVLAFNDTSLQAATSRRISAGRSSISHQRKEWALNAALAGYRGEKRKLTLRRENKTHSVLLPEEESNENSDPVTMAIVGNNIGYIRINNSLGKQDTVVAFQQAISKLNSSVGWVLDLRDTPGGGNTDVAEPIMGHFFSEKTAYQKIAPANEEPHLRFLHPTSPHIDAPLIVLVGRWTGSMGEGMAIGFDGSGRGEVRGSAMARLAGGTDSFTLEMTNIRVWLPTYNLLHINDTPRHDWTPANPIVADFGNSSDLLLMSAIHDLTEVQSP